MFGPNARGDARPDSDFDFLVDRGPNRPPFFPGGLQAAFEEILGRKVDVVTESSLDPKIRDKVLEESLPLSSDRDRLYLEHVLTCIRRVESYTAQGRSAFESQTMIQDAVVPNLQAIGESSKRLSDELRQTADEIPWKDIAGLRNVLVHDYLGIDLDSVWEIVSQDLAGLRVAVEGLLENAS